MKLADPLTWDCRYSDWSSCSYYCGDPPVETRYQVLVEDTKESRAMCPLLKEKPCETIACTGTNAHISAKNRYDFSSLQEPFVFGEWKETDHCSETCGKGKLLQQRSCTPTHPDKSCSSLPTSDTWRPGNKNCMPKLCKGD